MPNHLAKDESGLASTMVAFLIAGVLFIGSIGAVLLTTRQGATGAAASTVPQADLHVQAQSLAQVLVFSAGSASGQNDWASGVNYAGYAPLADQVTRLGLQSSGSGDPLLMSYGKFQNLRRAPFAASATDGYVNYPEARAGLGLDQAGLDFHVRAYPSLPQVADLIKAGKRDLNMHVTYLGDIDATRNHGQAAPTDPAAGLNVTVPTCTLSPLSASPSAQAYRLSVTATNGGTTTTQFTALFTYVLNGTASESQNANGPVLSPGQSATLNIDVPAALDTKANRIRSCAAGSTILADVLDPGSVHVQTSVTLASDLTTARTAPRDLWLDTSKPYFVNPNGATSACSDPVRLYYDGTGLVGGTRGEWLRVKVLSGSTVKLNASFQAPQTSSQRTIPGVRNAPPFWSGCLPAGQYAASLYFCGTSTCTGESTRERVDETVVVVAAAPAGYVPESAPAPQGAYEFTSKDWSRKEVAFLNTLVANFCPTYYDRTSGSPLNSSVDWGTWGTRCSGFKSGAAQPGDVIPDSKDILNNDLPQRLVSDPSNCDSSPRYDLVNVLVAGSNIDQTAMTSAAAKHCVATWVNGGGYLIVFGSTDQNVNWLEPIFHSAIRSSSGGLATPDAGNPVLSTADTLDQTNYVNNNRVWQFSGQTAKDAAQLFTNVVVQGTDPVLTISNPGALGDGKVTLMTWQPYNLYGGNASADTASLEGMKLVNNVLMQGYRDLYLDYGPALPLRANVEPAVARVHILHPQFDEPILLDVSVYVFPH